MATKKSAVAKRQEAQPPSTLVNDMQADEGKGLEGADKESFAIPFLAVLQTKSPQVEDELVEGAKAGMFFNTITNELFKTVKVIPCGFQRKYIQWGLREDGGGFKGIHNPIDVDSGKLETYTDDKGRLRFGDDQLKDTRIHYLMVQSASGAWAPAVLSLSSTQIKKSKRFMSLIQGVEFKTDTGKPFTPPSYANLFDITTVKEKNDMGSWFGIEVVKDRRIQDNEAELYVKCKSFSEQVSAGTVKVAEPTDEDSKDDGPF